MSRANKNPPRVQRRKRHAKAKGRANVGWFTAYHYNGCAESAPAPCTYVNNTPSVSEPLPTQIAAYHSSAERRKATIKLSKKSQQGQSKVLCPNIQYPRQGYYPS